MNIEILILSQSGMRILFIALLSSVDIVLLLMVSSSDLVVKCSLYPVKRYPDENSLKLFQKNQTKRPPNGGLLNRGCYFYLLWQ